MRALTLAPLLFLTLTACTGQAEGEIDPDRPERACADGVDNDEDGLTDCADDDCDGDAVCDEEQGEPEICDDGVDNDLDGLADCEDVDDCGDVAPCWWPETIEHQGDFSLEAGVFECYGIQVGQDKLVDCTEYYTSTLTQSGGDCPGCDLTMSAPLSWQKNECRSAYPDLFNNPLQEEANLGFRFISKTEWALWAKGEDGAWKEAAVMVDTGSGFSIAESEDIWIPNPEELKNCPEEEQFVGTFTTTLSFQPGQ